MASKKLTQTEKLTAAIDTIMDHFDNPEFRNTYDPAAKVWVRKEVNTLAYYQQDTLYWMLRNVTVSLSKNEGYLEKLGKKLNSELRANTNTEITLGKVRNARIKIEDAQSQRAHLTQLERVLQTVWTQRFPERKFTMPEAKEKAPVLDTASSNELEAELAAIAKMGISIDSNDMPTESTIETATA